MGNDICGLIEQLDEILNELETQNLDDELHVALELGHHFRDELNLYCES
jgi:hypothetical protein